MTTELKNKMIRKGRIILNSPVDFLINYAISIGFGTLGLAALIKSGLSGQIASGATLFFVSFTWLLAFTLYLIQRVGLKLERETLDLEREEIYKVLHEVGEKHNWSIVLETADVIIADSTRLFRADNRITILLDGKEIYINARSTGREFSLFRQGKLTDDFRLALRRRYFEIQHQKRLGAEASR